MVWTLSKIRSKVRNLTGSPSTNQITNAEVDEYIENFYTQDLLSLLNLEELDDYFRLRTYENVDTYGNLPSTYALNGPAWVNGREVAIFKDESAFYQEYPQNYKTRESLGSGDGATVNFTGTLTESPVSQENIVIDDDNEFFSPRELTISAITQASPAAITTNQNHLLSTGDKVQIVKIQSGMTEINNVVAKITKTSNTSFTLDGIDSSSFSDYESGGFILPLTTIPLEGNHGGTGTVTVSSGAYDITFNSAPSDGQDIRANYENYTAGEPDAILYNDRNLIVRPFPDGTYDIKISITKKPDLFNRDGTGDISDDNATLVRDDWGKLIAYGAAIDLLNDRNQQEVAIMLMPQYDNLLDQVNTRWIRNYAGERSTPTF